MPDKTKTTQNDRPVKDYIASLGDEQTVKDSQVLLEMMQRISGHKPKLWNAGTIGFDTYHYKYDSGREGDGHVIGFYPRKAKITVYLMDGTARHAELLPKQSCKNNFRTLTTDLSNNRSMSWLNRVVPVWTSCMSCQA